MLRSIINSRRVTQISSESGFSLMELIGVLIIFMIVVVVVVLMVSGVFGSSREASMDTDINTIDTAVGQYILKSQGKVPTSNGQLPSEGQYAIIDFNASFKADGKTYSFYPDCIKKLPKHYDEGVWRIDNKGVISVDMEPSEY